VNAGFPLHCQGKIAYHIGNFTEARCPMLQAVKENRPDHGRWLRAGGGVLLFTIGFGLAALLVRTGGGLASLLKRTRKISFDVDIDRKTKNE
jgi:hypothetical protein